MTINEFMQKFPNYEKVEYNNNIYLRNIRPCGHYDVYNTFNNNYYPHSYMFKGNIMVRILNKNIEYMTVEKNKLIETYKNNPEYRKLLVSLYGNFLDIQDLELIFAQDKILQLEKELNECKSQNL